MSETLIEQVFCRKSGLTRCARPDILVTVLIGPLIVSKSGDRSKTKVQFPTFCPNEDSHWQIVAALERDYVEHNDYQCKWERFFGPMPLPVSPYTRRLFTRNRGMFQGCYWMTPTPRVSTTSSQRTHTARTIALSRCRSVVARLRLCADL